MVQIWLTRYENDSLNTLLIAIINSVQTKLKTYHPYQAHYELNNKANIEKITKYSSQDVCIVIMIDFKSLLNQF